MTMAGERLIASAKEARAILQEMNKAALDAREKRGGVKLHPRIAKLHADGKPGFTQGETK